MQHRLLCSHLFRSFLGDVIEQRVVLPLWHLHVAGDWSDGFDTEASALRHRMMRCVLVTIATESVWFCPRGEDGLMGSPSL